jgi:hypothetical protein
MDTELRFNFDRAWQLRLNQKLDEALLAFAKLKDPVRSAANEQDDLELTILSASLSRARGEIEAAKSTIEEIEQKCADLAQPLPSRLLVERGLNEFYLENYSAAFDDFLNVVARINTETNSVLLAQATLNALLCAEYLGLSPASLEKNYADAKKLVGDIDISGLDSQWQAYQIRRAWALGKFENIKIPRPAVWNQATYHIHFLRSLPFLDESKFPIEDLTDSLRSHPEPYLRSYWLRTLTGQYRSEDLLVNKVSEFAERIYLWTWYWLTGREMQLEKIVPYVEALLGHISESHLTQMDQEFINLSLGWIALFSPRFETLKNQVVTQFSTLKKSSDLPFLEYERLIQGCVESRLRGSDENFAKMVSLHPAHKSKHHQFGAILQSLQDLNAPVPVRLQGLVEKIKHRLDEERDFRHSEIAVDLEKMTATNKLTDEKIASESICLALQLLSDGKSISCSEFVEVVFQQKGYDDYMHSARIFNLLARIRAFLPENLMVTKKSDRILTRGDWSIIKIKKTNERGEPRRIPALATPAPKKYSNKIFEKLSQINRARFNRKDVEKKFHLSRAAAHRLVREWIKGGFVETQGSGPSRKYIVSDKWRVMHP